MQLRTLTAPLALALALAAPVAHAGDDAREAAAELAAAKITLAQAIAAAEAHHPGSQAVKADLDSKLGRAVVEVDVYVPATHTLHEVTVDAVDAKVLHSRIDH